MSDTLRTDLSELSCAHMDDQEWGAAGWDHARQLERELAEVTKQRDALVNAIRKHKTTLAFMPDYCDVVLYKTLDELEQGGQP